MHRWPFPIPACAQRAKHTLRYRRYNQQRSNLAGEYRGRPRKTLLAPACAHCRKDIRRVGLTDGDCLRVAQ